MRGEGLAVALEPDDRLHLRLGHVAVQPDAVLAAEGHAGADELVGAVVRDRGRHRDSDLFGSELPARERLAHVGFARLPRRRAELLDVLLHSRAENPYEPGDRLEEGAVGDHRRDDRAHTDLGVRAANRLQPFERGCRPLERQVVGGRAALEHHLDRAQLRAQVLVLERSPAAEPGPCGEQELERPAVTHSLGEVAVRVGMSVDQPGMKQEAARVDDRCIGRRGEPGGADLADRVALDQHVRRLRAVGADIEQDAAADDADYRRAQRRALASWIARQTRSGVTGMSRWRTPSGASASLTALSSAGSAPTVPASPTPLAPSGFTCVGTSWASTSNAGMSSARGIA